MSESQFHRTSFARLTRYLMGASLLMVIAAAITACNSDNPVVLPVGQLRVANAITDSNPIDATIVGIPSGIDNIGFGSGSGLKDAPDGSYRVQLTTTTSSGQATFSADSTPINKHHITTVYAVGKIAASTQAAFVVLAPRTDVPANQTEFQFVNASAATVGPVDVFVTAPGATLIGVTPTANLAFPASSTPALIAPGTYEIRVTTRGNPLNVLFDSGPVGVTLSGGSSRQYGLLDNINPAIAAPIFLLVLSDTGGTAQIQNGSS